MSEIDSVKITDHTLFPLSIIAVGVTAIVSVTFWISGISSTVSEHSKKLDEQSEILKERQVIIRMDQDIQDIKEILVKMEDVHIKRSERIYNQINDLKQNVYKMQGQVELLVQEKKTAKK